MVDPYTNATVADAKSVAMLNPYEKEFTENPGKKSGKFWKIIFRKR